MGASSGRAQGQESNAIISFMAALGVVAAVAAVWTPTIAHAQKMPYTNDLKTQQAEGKKLSKKYNANEGRLWGPEPNQKYVQPTTEGQPGQRNIPPAIDVRSYFPTKDSKIYKDALPLMRPNECDGGC